ncbi:response regulator transcription factor [Paenarthrobacter sp. AB444]|uniref:response regulator transcription factor n=1 Tax=Paenarthrobacter sp. AB444 TaxID=3025681 RepID=UPI0023657F07|nr:response regulator transcription factor [Paenarthrobacter sp. AB444]MDD7837253.1 response regulator transcription factor [Paenarthrobacter sp. AB444]
MVTRLVVVDRHQLMIDTLDAWLRRNAPDLVVAAGFTTVPTHLQEDAWTSLSATVAVLGTLDHRADLVPAVGHLVRTGLRVVVLATALDPWDAEAVRSAGALGYVPKAAGPEHMESALRAAAAGQQYVHPDAMGHMADSTPERVKLSPREQRLAELYLGSDPLPVRGVADAMGISEQTVKAHLHRIRQRYATAGVKVGNVISLRKQLTTDGWIS